MGNYRSRSLKPQCSKFDKNICIHSEDGKLPVIGGMTEKNEDKNVTSINVPEKDVKPSTDSGGLLEPQFVNKEAAPDQRKKGNQLEKMNTKPVERPTSVRVWKTVSDRFCFRTNEEDETQKQIIGEINEKAMKEVNNRLNENQYDDSQSHDKFHDKSHSGRATDSEKKIKTSDTELELREAINRLRADEQDWCKWLNQISKTVRTSNNPEDMAEALIEENFVGKLEEFLDMHHVSSFEKLKLDAHAKTTVWPVIKRFLIIFWITCDKNVNFCQYILRTKVFLFLVSELRILSSENYEHYEIFLFSIKSILGILHNISRHVPNSKWNLRNEGLVTILRTFLPSEIPMVRLKSLMVLSYLLSEAENEIINSDDDNFVFIFKVLTDALSSEDHKSSKYGMSATEVLKGVNNLAINDENKIRIVRNGALPLYQDILKTGYPEEVKVTIMILWSLAFHHYNKRKMREMPGIMGKLYELRQCDDDEICHAARGTFWELENTSKSALGKFSSSAEKDPNQPHIMISYQWDSQPIMLKVKDRLKHAGYKVWMDVEHMSGSTLEAMALAVEKAAVVLICMSEKYKNSPNCRTEAEYVYRLRKDFVPLRLQQEYVPDGWLGILVGTRLYFDIYSEEAIDAALPKLMKELNDRGRISPSLDDIDNCSPEEIAYKIPRRMMSRQSVPMIHEPVGTEVMNWACQDVKDWLTVADMAEVHQQFQEIDGQLLLELQKIQKTAPEFFFTMLRNDYQLTPSIILKFSRVLRCLR